VNRAEKRGLVESLNERFKRATITIRTEFAGLSVAEMNRLRQELREVKGEYKVAKNTMLKLAVRDTPYAVMIEQLDGQTGLAFGEADAAEVARVLVRFAEQHAGLRITGGALEGEVLTDDAIDWLARLPSKEVVLAQLLGVIQAPATELVRLIQEPATRLVRLAAEIEKKRKAE